MKIATERVHKGELKMRSLATEIRDLSDACGRIEGSVSPGPQLELDRLDSLIIAIDHALVTIRTLDHEVFEPSDPAYYAKARSTTPTGLVVRGLTGPRNNAVHDYNVIDPDLGRAVGPLDHRRFLVFPRWRARAQLPADVFRKSSASVGVAYDSHVAGRLVLDTLFDAFAFFDGCAPDLAERDSAGELRPFPLPPLPVGGYCRLHPDWPTHEEVDLRIRNQAVSSPPGGMRRVVIGRVQVTAGFVFCGYTIVDSATRETFTERQAVIRDDVAAGYSYVVIRNGSEEALEVENGEVRCQGVQLEDLSLPDLASDAARPWADWWQLCQDDAGFYRDRRMQTQPSARS